MKLVKYSRRVRQTNVLSRLHERVVAPPKTPPTNRIDVVVVRERIIERLFKKVDDILVLRNFVVNKNLLKVRGTLGV